MMRSISHPQVKTKEAPTRNQLFRLNLKHLSLPHVSSIYTMPTLVKISPSPSLLEATSGRKCQGMLQHKTYHLVTENGSQAISLTKYCDKIPRLIQNPYLLVSKSL